MEPVFSKITILFEAPFWVCLYEREYRNRYEVCKITFGAEPKDYEVYAFLLRHWNELSFSPPIASDGINRQRINPKRMQRMIRQQTAPTGLGTKAQQALNLAREQGKTVRKVRSKALREEQKEQHFAQKQEKRKEKHKGH